MVPAARLALIAWFGTAGVLATLAAGQDMREPIGPVVSEEPPILPLPPSPLPPSRGKNGEPAKPPPIRQFKRLSERMTMGAQPEGDEDFAFLAREGVKTIVSVDGARPDVDRAAKYGIRYVHVPIGYDGIPRDKQVVLARAFEELPGPFYVHCHHGKHRGAAACMIGRIVLEKIDVDQAVSELRAQGTDPKYRGLYAVPSQFKPLTAEERAAPIEFPAFVKVTGTRASMVQIDESWARMTVVKFASWLPPADHPDVDPSHEATILAERLRELGRTEDTAKRDATYRKLLKASEDAVWELAAALKAAPVDPKRAGEAYDATAASCAKCHALYRDNR